MTCHCHGRLDQYLAETLCSSKSLQAVIVKVKVFESKVDSLKHVQFTSTLFH